jgi:hypothetical protein
MPYWGLSNVQGPSLKSIDQFAYVPLSAQFDGYRIILIRSDSKHLSEHTI